ncbi:MAG: hypothetical protein ACYDH9_06390 [Limisphaerales bacterium]
MNLLAAGSSWESLLILIVFVVLSALSNWMKKKSGQPEEGAGDEPHPTPSPPAHRTRTIPVPPAPARPQKPIDWQEALRRLLEGELPAPPPPPVVVQRPPPGAGPPPILGPQLGAATRRDAVESSESAGALASFTRSTAAYQKASQLDEDVAERLEQRASLADSMSAYQQASELDQTVAGHIRDVTSRPVQLTATVQRRIDSQEITQTKAMFRHPAAARQAIIASIILSPPKGLET